MNISDASMELLGGRIDVGEVPLLARVEMRASNLALLLLSVWDALHPGRPELDISDVRRVLWGDLSSYDATYVHLVEPASGAELGLVALNPPVAVEESAVDTVRGIVDGVGSALRGDEVAAGFISLGHQMVELGYDVVYAPDALSHLQFVASCLSRRWCSRVFFVGAYRYAYRGAARIEVRDVNAESALLSGWYATAVSSAAILVEMPCCGDALDDVYDAAASAIKRLSPGAAVRRAPGRDDASLLIEVTAGGGGSEPLALADFMGRYVPGLAEVVKGHVDARLGGAKRAPA